MFRVESSRSLLKEDFLQSPDNKLPYLWRGGVNNGAMKQQHCPTNAVNNDSVTVHRFYVFPVKGLNHTHEYVCHKVVYALEVLETNRCG